MSTLHNSTRGKLAKEYGEQYKTDPEGVKKLLAEKEQLDAEQIAVLCKFLDAQPKTATPPSSQGNNKPTPPASTGGKPAPVSPYKDWDIQKGKWETIGGDRTFTPVGKDVKSGIKMTDSEADAFNDARESIENNILTERCIPHVK